MKFLTFFAIAGAMLLTIETRAGDKAHGGDTYAIEFVRLGKEIFRDLQERNVILPGMTLSQLERKMAAVTVSSTKDILVLGGEIKDALNYPDELKIIFNRDSWKDYDLKERKSLVTHEFFSVSGLPDSNYLLTAGVLVDEFAPIVAVGKRGMKPITGTVERVSVEIDGSQIQGNTRLLQISRDGTKVLFQKDEKDIYLYDLNVKKAKKLSFSYDGQELNNGKHKLNQGTLIGNIQISDRGNYIAFMTRAKNIVADDDNQSMDAFIYNTKTGQAERVTPSCSVYGLDTYQDNVTRIELSANGAFLALSSNSPCLNPKDRKGDTQDGIFIYNISTKSLTRLDTIPIERDRSCGYTNTMSLNADGSVLAFSAYCDNHTYVYDFLQEKFELVGMDLTGQPISTHYVNISGDGNIVMYQGGGFGYAKNQPIYVYDRLFKKVEIITRNGQGEDASRKIQNYDEIDNRMGKLNHDGRFATFASNAINLVTPTPVNRQAYVYDRLLKRHSVISINDKSEYANMVTNGVSIDGGGNLFAFESRGNNLVSNDTNSSFDVFVFHKR